MFEILGNPRAGVGVGVAAWGAGVDGAEEGVAALLWGIGVGAGVEAGGGGAVSVTAALGDEFIIFVLVLADTTLDPLLKARVAVPELATALNVTVATSWAPVTLGIAPRPIWTVPPAPELCAAMPKALELVMYMNCRPLGYVKLAWTALTGSEPEFS
jgi:hypothetical protein